MNGDGMVDASEMEAVLASLGYHLDPSPAAGIIAHMDPAGDGLVNWDTFKRVRSMHKSDELPAEETGEAKDAGPTPRQLLRALVQFMTMDHSGTGLLTEDAMRCAPDHCVPLDLHVHCSQIISELLFQDDSVLPPCTAWGRPRGQTQRVLQATTRRPHSSSSR